MNKRMKWVLLTLAAWMRQGQVETAINTVRDRPLKNQPDWFLGWALIQYKGNIWPGAKILYAACDAEWKMRRDLEHMKPEVRAAAEALIEPPKMLFQRWQVDCPVPARRDGLVPGFTTPKGSRMVQEMRFDYGKGLRLIIDVPAGEQIVVTDAKVTAAIIGFGYTEGVLDEAGEHLNIKG